MTCSKRAHAALELFEQRQQRTVDDDDRVLGVVRDVAEVVGMQAQVERVEDGAHRRARRGRLEVAVVVPAERADAVALLHAEPRERVRELLVRR